MKRLISGILALSLVFCVTACGDEVDNTSTMDTSKSETTTPMAESSNNIPDGWEHLKTYSIGGVTYCLPNVWEQTETSNEYHKFKTDNLLFSAQYVEGYHLDMRSSSEIEKNLEDLFIADMSITSCKKIYIDNKKGAELICKSSDGEEFIKFACQSESGMIFFNFVYYENYDDIAPITDEFLKEVRGLSNFKTESTTTPKKTTTTTATTTTTTTTSKETTTTTTTTTTAAPITYPVLYEDDNVKISFYEIGKDTYGYEDSVIFYVENKNDFEITIQCSSISLDGIQIDGSHTMSDEVAPLSKAKVYACYRNGIDNKNPLTITGVLRIIDFSDEHFDTYDAQFVNVSVG